MLSGDWHAVRDLVNNVQFLNRDGVYFVEDVDGWDVHAVALDDVDEVISRGVFPEVNVSAVDAVLS